MKSRILCPTILLLSAIAGLAAADVPKYGLFETAITNTTDYANKFRDVLLEATFTSPSGERTIPFWGFFDGDGSGGGDRLDVTAFPADNAGEISGTVWKLRFMPDEVGTWTYTWQFSDGSASGNGSFACVEAGAKPGVLNPAPDNPRWLQTADGTPFFPKNTYILPGEQLCYPVSDYAPNVYQKYIDMGANFIVFPWMPIWSWNTSQTWPYNGSHEGNGPTDRNLLLWYQTGDWHDGWYDESPDISIYDTNRMNLFTWKRLEQHLGWLADQGVYTWGFQGFHIKRSFGIFPQNFPADQYQWYVRYCMARLAPFYNLLWNNTWESSGGSEDFKRLTQEEGFDPWRRIYLQVGSNGSQYDVLASDTKVDFTPASGFDSKPMWSTEGNELWGAEESDWDRVWRFICDGAMCLPTETRNPYSGGNLAVDWDLLGGTAMQRNFHAFTFFGDEVDFAPIRPHRELVAGSDTYCAAEPGRQYLCYDRDGSAITLTVELGTYDVLWLDPVSDARSQGDTVTLSAGAHAFTPPSADYKILYVYGSGVIDDTPPSTVTNLQAEVVHDARVELRWDAASDPESLIANYRVYRDGTLLATATQTSYVDTTTAAETDYRYTVTARNGVGLEGEHSDPVDVTTPAYSPPPTVAISTPVDEAVHETGAPLTISADASDDGAVVAVEFLVITQSGGQDEVLRVTDDDSSDGWSIAWSEPGIGDYDLTATATDDLGKTTGSAAVVLHVRDPLSLSLAADPVSGEAPLTVQFNATATGGDGGGAVPELLWWELEAGEGSSAADSSDAGHAGVIDGATWTTGRDGPCLEFGGDGDQVVDEDAEDYLNGLDAVSVVLWVKSDDLGTDQGLFTCRSPDGSDEGLSLRYDSSGAGGGGVNVIKVGLSTSGGGTDFESAAGVQTTEWQHLCLTWQSGSPITLYVNGVATTPTVAGSSPSGTLSGLSTLIVGRGPKDNSGGWDGLIDDVRIYNRALNAEEVDDVASGAGSYSFAWDFDNDGVTDSEAIDPVHTFTADGVYPVTCTVTDALGSSVSDTVTITVGAISLRRILMDNIDSTTWDCAPAGTVSYPTGQTRIDDLDAAVDHVLRPVSGGAG